MMDERLPPRVQDGEEADGGPEVLRVSGNGPERFGGRAEEDAVDHGRIL
mgnify:CR=1 FL=1